jgi:peptidoglycan/xylan/chitin deacetylase (PgdA/CDA1 family)
MTSALRQIKRAAKASAQFIASHLGPHRLGSGARLWVLMYHRVLPAHDARFRDEEPGMIVTPDSFRQQLRALKRLFTVMPLAEWTERRAAGKPLPERACAVTFDDGWRDNYEYAFPLLQQEQVPATVFAVSHMIGTRQQFWPNRLAQVLAADNREELHTFSWLAQLPGYHASGPLSREKVAAIIGACKQFSDVFLQDQLTLMEQRLQIREPKEAALMNWSQLTEMQSSGLVDIGSHTRHHCRLVEGLPEAMLQQEIIDSRKHLEERLDRPVTLFCYPNGDSSAAAVKLVRENYRAAVTTMRGINTPTTAVQALLRIGIHEDISDTPTRFRARLSGWL